MIKGLKKEVLEAARMRIKEEWNRWNSILLMPFVFHDTRTIEHELEESGFVENHGPLDLDLSESE
jgi:hypothetical protein